MPIKSQLFLLRRNHPSSGEILLKKTRRYGCGTLSIKIGFKLGPESGVSYPGASRSINSSRMFESSAHLYGLIADSVEWARIA
jgi:hypothetical protein